MARKRNVTDIGFIDEADFKYIAGKPKTKKHDVAPARFEVYTNDKGDGIRFIGSGSIIDMLCCVKIGLLKISESNSIPVDYLLDYLRKIAIDYHEN